MFFKNYSILLICLLLMACSITKKIKTGQSAFELKQYAKAIELLKIELADNSDTQTKAFKSFILAESYSKLGNYKEAHKYYEKAYRLNYGEKAIHEYAYSLKILERYDEAKKVFGELYSLTKNTIYNNEITICETVSNWKNKNTQAFKLKSLNSNTEFSEYSPILFEDKFLVFSSDRFTAIGDEVYNWTGRDYSDLFIMTKSGASVYNFDANLNTRANEGSACFNKAFTEIFFTRCQSIAEADDHCRIYYSNRFSGTWTDPRPLFFFEESTNFGQPTLIENDSVIIFSVETDSYTSSHDLFYAVRSTDGWSQPESMPGQINTEGDELLPTSDGDTLYFSSDFHSGMGGLDIFKTYIQADKSWSKPENLKYPINSGADDFSFIVDRTLDSELISGFVCSNRNGSDDIFSYKQIKHLKDDPIEPVEEPAEETEEVYIAISVVELIRENDNPNSTIKEKKALPSANLKMIADVNLENLELDQEGKVIHQIEQNKTYKFKAEKIGYLTHSKLISTSKLDFEGSKIKTINIELTLEKIPYNQEIILENIYYDFDKWDIRQDAKIVLDSLVNLLEDNPLIAIQMGSHTDCRGELEYNETLSQKRAQSAVDYLIGEGIVSTRLTAKGFGESKLINTCECEKCTEDLHQLNRRTGFTILR